MIDMITNPEEEEGLNPIAIEILRRGIEGIEPLIPEWAEGVRPRGKGDIDTGTMMSASAAY